MATSCLRTCVAWLIAIPLMIIVLVLLAGTVILAAIGIDRATEFNTCVGANDTENCVPGVTIVRSFIGNATAAPRMQVIDGVDPNEYIHWMAGATGCGILFAFVATFGLCFLEYAIYRVRKQPGDHTDAGGENIPMRNLSPGTSASTQETSPSPPEVHLDTVESKGNEKIVLKPPVKLRKLVGKSGIGALFMLFFGLLFFICGVLALLWSVAIGYNFTRSAEKEVYPFVVVELLVAVICPIFLLIAGILIAVVLNYVTRGALDGRLILPRLLRNVKFEKGENSDFWIIVDSFYFTLKRPKEDKDGKAKQIGCGVCYSCFPNFATWIITALAGLCLVLAASYFVDRTIDQQITVTSCDDPAISREFSCFNASTLAFVDCTDNRNVEVIHCFRFYQFGVDVDLISSLASAFAFYLVAVHSITIVFGVMQVLLHLHQTKFWGGVFVAFGFVALTAVIVVVIIWATGYIEARLPELPRLNIVNLAQLIMVCWFIILVGILIVTSTWVEKVSEKGKKSGSNTGDAASAAARSASPTKI